LRWYNLALMETNSFFPTRGSLPSMELIALTSGSGSTESGAASSSFFACRTKVSVGVQLVTRCTVNIGLEAAGTRPLAQSLCGLRLRVQL
jgi:hypothetical protein